MSEMKNVLITGCSSGIGLCVAKGLKSRGYRVFATARKSQDVERLQRQGFVAFRLDLDESRSIAKTLDLVLEQTRDACTPSSITVLTANPAPWRI